MSFNLSLKLLCAAALVLISSSCVRRDGAVPSASSFDLSDTVDVKRLEHSVLENLDDYELYNRLMVYYIDKAKHRSIIDYSTVVFDNADRTGNDRLKVCSGVYLSQAYLQRAMPDSMYYYISKVDNLAREQKMYSAQVIINNTLGIHNLIYAMNYSEALDCYYEALDACIRSGQGKSRNYYTILSNIVNTYYIRNDTSALDMAYEIYNYGVKSGDEYVHYSGAIGLAYMLLLDGDYGQALAYVEEASTLTYYDSDFNNSDALRGSILASLGNDREAITYFERSLKHSSDDYSTLIESYLRYGDFLMSRGRNLEATEKYLKGISLAESKHLFFHGHKLYNSISEAYTALGRNDRALEYMRKYQDIVDTVFNVERERSFNNLRYKYETQKKQNELNQSRIEYHKKVFFAGCMSLLLIVTVVVLYVLYRKKSNMYRKLVQINKKYLAREKVLEEKLRKMSASRYEEADMEMLRSLYGRIDSLIESKELYRNKDISPEVIAEMLFTTKTNVINAVRMFTDYSFSAYINSFRVHKAIEILSDPENDMPIKALVDYLGYNNMSPFYVNFQRETGVPPSKFRKEASKIK